MKKYYMISLLLILFGLLIGVVIPAVYSWFTMSSDLYSYILPMAHAAIDFWWSAGVTPSEIVVPERSMTGGIIRVMMSLVWSLMIMAGFGMLIITSIVHLIKAISKK